MIVDVIVATVVGGLVAYVLAWAVALSRAGRIGFTLLVAALMAVISYAALSQHVPGTEPGVVPTTITSWRTG